MSVLLYSPMKLLAFSKKPALIPCRFKKLKATFGRFGVRTLNGLPF